MTCPMSARCCGEAQAGAFYSSADPQTLAEAVRRLVETPICLPQGRRNALRFARERFNWQVQSETLYALYQGRCAEPRKPPALLGAR